ncbi:MAG: A24 family peptidase [Clostridiales bacterium]|nr:A24 family peptidase [Clostridiales bacterium]
MILAIAAFTDLKYRKIPNWIDVLLGIYAVFFSTAKASERMAGFVLTAGIMYFLLIATGKIKGGDVKYLSLCAAAIGLKAFVQVLALACLFAVFWCVIRREKSVPLAFVMMLGYVLERIWKL